MKKLALLLIASFCLLSLTAIKKANVVQIDVTAILNARPVTIFNHGKLITWTKGIDGNGAGDGYLTMAAALFNGDKAPHALPDDAIFVANDFHPQIVLHYSNEDTAGNQARNVTGEDSFAFKIPAHTYSDMYLCLTSAEGPSQLQLQLVYTDGTETQNFLLPDYYDDLTPNGPNIMYVAHDLAKWDKNNKMAEASHHNIDAANIHPDKKRTLTAIKINKGKAGYLVFWGATGVIAE